MPGGGKGRKVGASDSRTAACSGQEAKGQAPSVRGRHQRPREAVGELGAASSGLRPAGSGQWAGCLCRGQLAVGIGQWATSSGQWVGC